MSEVFSIQLSNHTTQPDGKTVVWLDLPATAEQVQAAMGQIGVTQDNPWDYFISSFFVPEGHRLAIPYDMVLASGVNELNFLAARLEKLNEYEIGTLNAALQQKGTEMRTIWRMINYADNLVETIRATANDLITKIDGRLAQLQQEREAQQVEAPSIWNGLDGLINDKPWLSKVGAK